MNQIFLSTYCVAFQDYPWLIQCIRSFPDFPIGVEFATSWTTPDFDQQLIQQIPIFSGIPTTLHAPFVEICTVPGSVEAQQMEKEFEKACRLYSQFHAQSIVMHTHEGRFPFQELPRWQARALEVLLEWTRHMRRQGMQVTVENVGYPHKGNVLFDQEQFIALFDELPPEVGCLIDIGHALLNRWDILALIHCMGPRIRGYHLNNNDGIHDTHYPIYDPGCICPPQEMDRILEAIAQYTPESHLILEYAPEPRFTAESLHQDIRRIASIVS